MSYINRRNSPQGLELYTTLAHEGFRDISTRPCTVTAPFPTETGIPPGNSIRYGGYLEGWALYVEFSFPMIMRPLCWNRAGQSDAAQSGPAGEAYPQSAVVHVHFVGSPDPRGEGAGYDQVAEVLGKFGIDSPGTRG